MRRAIELTMTIQRAVQFRFKEWRVQFGRQGWAMRGSNERCKVEGVRRRPELPCDVALRALRPSAYLLLRWKAFLWSVACRVEANRPLPTLAALPPVRPSQSTEDSDWVSADVKTYRITRSGRRRSGGSALRSIFRSTAMYRFKFSFSSASSWSWDGAKKRKKQKQFLGRVLRHYCTETLRNGCQTHAPSLLALAAASKSFCPYFALVFDCDRVVTLQLACKSTRSGRATVDSDTNDTGAHHGTTGWTNGFV